MLRILYVSILFVFVSASTVFAQICAGAPTFNGAPLQVTGNLGMSEHAQMFGASFGGGTDTGFATIGVGGLKPDGINETGLAVGATMGADPAVDNYGRVRLCPLGSLTYTTGRELFGLDTANINLQIGGRLGVIAAETSTLQFIPTFGLAFAHNRYTLRLPEPIDDVTDVNSYTVASIGAGFVFNRRFAVTPLVSIPLGLDDSDPQFNLTLSVNMGH